MNKEVNGNKGSWNIEKDEEDTRRMITRTARFNVNEETSLKKKIKTCNEKAIAQKLEKGNNPRIFCSATFEGVKEIIENTVSKATK